MQVRIGPARSVVGDVLVGVGGVATGLVAVDDGFVIDLVGRGVVRTLVGGVGVLGFCFGGTYAYLVAAEYEPDVAISYYGSGVAGAIDRAEDIECPTLFHFGGQDPYLPVDQIETIRDAVVGMSHIEILVQPEGGHAFDNHASEMFHQPEAAAAAWTRTAAFLHEHLSGA